MVWDDSVEIKRGNVSTIVDGWLTVRDDSELMHHASWKENSMDIGVVFRNENGLGDDSVLFIWCWPAPNAAGHGFISWLIYMHRRFPFPSGRRDQFSNTLQTVVSFSNNLALFVIPVLPVWPLAWSLFSSNVSTVHDDPFSGEHCFLPSSTVKKFKAIDQHVLVDDDYAEDLGFNLINVSLYSRSRHFDWNLLSSQVNEHEYRAFGEETPVHSWMIRGWDSNDSKTDWS